MLAGKKMVRRDKPYRTLSYMSGESSLTNDSGLTDIEDDAEVAPTDMPLPNFLAQKPLPNDDISDDSDDEVIDPEYQQRMAEPEVLEASDSDDDAPSHILHNTSTAGLEPQGSPHSPTGLHRHITSHSRASRDLHDNRSHHSSHNFFRRPSLFGRGETDITDQGSHVTGGSQGRSSTLFKDIFRRVALTDQQYSERPSHGDSFIGRIMDSEDSQGLGLNGGGLVPGATRRSRDNGTIDEEEEVGMDEIEMQKLDFAQLNNEARNLINVHLPQSMQQPTFNITPSGPQLTSNDQMFVLGNNNGFTATTGSSSDTVTEENKAQTDHDMYAPNPDLFLRGDVQYNDADEFLMLDENSDSEIAPPSKVQAGVLSSLLKLYQNPDESKSSSSLFTGDHTTLNELDESSRPSTHISLHGLKDGLKTGGKKVYDSFVKKSTTNLEAISDEEKLTGEAEGLPSFQNAKPKHHKKTTIVNPSDYPSKMGKKLRNAKKKQDRQLRITVHIANVLQRQRFIMLMCKALMLFGAPTHRLEEYMVMTSRVLEIDGQFTYLPGCMIMAFGDAATRTSEVHLIKCSQGLNLAKLSDTHKIYKSVIHDLMNAEEASAKLSKILKLKNNYNPWLCVLFYGLGSASVCPFAFSGGWVDIPIAFGVGCCVGYLQFFVSSVSNLYSSVFEVAASIVVSFISRAIGSINGGQLFCFSAIAQGSLALILPGYIILCGSLELQSRNLVAGSVRMFYAIIYSLFLGFGITLGSALYGWVDKNSVSEVSCPTNHAIDAKWRILFVPAFTCCLGLINQARLVQLPIMVVIAGCGYIGTYFAGQHFNNVTEFTASIGAFIVGILGNLYSRIWKGLAVSAMLPAIFVQVPSGIASQSSLLSGVQAANQITGNSTTSSSDSSSLAFGATMVEVSIGISVGLFAAALFVYPFGKKRTGLFSL